MDYRFNKTLLVILSLSSLLLSSNAVPSTRVIDFISTSVPAAVPKSSAIDFTSTSFPAKAPSSIDFISTGVPAEASKVAKVVTEVDPEITKLCNDGLSTYETRCIETLSKLFQGPFDIVKAIEIAEIEVNATLSAAKTIFDTIIKLRNDTASTDKKTIASLDCCIEMYDLIVYQVSSAALELLPQKKLSAAYNQINSVLQYNGFCQECWDEDFPDVKPWDATPLIMPTVISVDILSHIA